MGTSGLTCGANIMLWSYAIRHYTNQNICQKGRTLAPSYGSFRYYSHPEKEFGGRPLDLAQDWFRGELNREQGFTCTPTYTSLPAWICKRFLLYALIQWCTLKINILYKGIELIMVTKDVIAERRNRPMVLFMGSLLLYINFVSHIHILHISHEHTHTVSVRTL